MVTCVCMQYALCMVCMCALFRLVLGNISIFWKYRDISFDNILYRGNFLISKYRISILIVFIVFMYATHEIYSLDMSTRAI